MATYKQPCGQCGELIERDSRACPKCGTRGPFGFSCPYCLRQVAKGDLVCSGCAKPLTVECPVCKAKTFIGGAKCDACGISLMVLCENKRCGIPQYFTVTKCTACGKPVKDGAKKIAKNKGGV